MDNRKHTRCSQCGFKAKCRLLELLWRIGSRGPWHYVGGSFCVPCRVGLVGFISGLGDVQLVGDA